MVFIIIPLTIPPVASGNKFTIRADDTNVVPSGARGRDSIRITSHKAYTDSIIILDLAHMPGGCGQWSAFWSYSPNDWPNGGEVDMIEVYIILYKWNTNIHADFLKTGSLIYYLGYT